MHPGGVLRARRARTALWDARAKLFASEVCRSVGFCVLRRVLSRVFVGDRLDFNPSAWSPAPEPVGEASTPLEMEAAAPAADGAAQAVAAGRGREPLARDREAGHAQAHFAPYRSGDRGGAGQEIQARMIALRVVLDTNIVVSSALKPDGL